MTATTEHHLGPEPLVKTVGLPADGFMPVRSLALDACAETGRIWHIRLVPGTRSAHMGRDPLGQIRVPVTGRPSPAGDRHAARYLLAPPPMPLCVAVARATRRSNPSPAPGAASPRQDRGLRAAGVTNGQSDGGAFEPFH
jgi:hypothetical protein